MKKVLSLLLTLVLAISLLTACGSSKPAEKTEMPTAAAPEAASTEAPAAETDAKPDATEAETEAEEKADAAEPQVLKVAATAAPHAEILEICKPILAEQNIDLQITVFDDYIQPNTATDEGEVDANYFQHITYLNDFNAEKGTKLVSVTAIHYEPFAIYPGKLSSLDDLAEGSTIAVPNDTTNEARALLLLQDLGYIKLRDGAQLTATKLDIEVNPKNLNIEELAAQQLPRSLPDVDFAVINGNFAMQAGLSVEKDALATEKSDSDASQAYANVLVVKEGNEENAAVLALAEVLKGDAVKAFVNEKYAGAVVLLDD